LQCDGGEQVRELGATFEDLEFLARLGISYLVAL
jgi:hypothetical protein